MRRFLFEQDQQNFLAKYVDLDDPTYAGAVQNRNRPRYNDNSNDRRRARSPRRNEYVQPYPLLA